MCNLRAYRNRTYHRQVQALAITLHELHVSLTTSYACTTFEQKIAPPTLPKYNGGGGAHFQKNRKCATAYECKGGIDRLRFRGMLDSTPLCATSGAFSAPGVDRRFTAISRSYLARPAHPPFPFPPPYAGNTGTGTGNHSYPAPPGTAPKPKQNKTEQEQTKP